MEDHADHNHHEDNQRRHAQQHLNERKLESVEAHVLRKLRINTVKITAVEIHQHPAPLGFPHEAYEHGENNNHRTHDLAKALRDSLLIDN